MVITPGKNFIGQKGFPTPSDIPTDLACRSFVLPDNDEWFGLLMGAVELLLNPHNYFNYGALSIDDTVDAWQAIIQDAYNRSLLGTCDPSIPAPYWDEDSADDADDEEAALTQTWYGQIVTSPSLLVAEDAELTFLDNLGIWAVAGFIAYAGLPGAALAFVPIAKKFVLAFKQHDLGGIVRVLFDFAEVAEIDTYGVEDAVLNLNIVAPDDGETHTMYVVMSDEHNPAITGAPNIQVIRKRLSESEVTPKNLRWNSDCNCVQQTPDGGATWGDNPAADPRSGAGFQLPPRGGSDPQCNAAENMVVKLKSITNIFEAEIAQLQAANAFLDLVLVFLPEVGIVIEALLAATELLLTIGADVIAAAFTDDQWDLVKCILYCDIAADGTVDQTRFDKILDDIHVQCSTVVYDVLYTIFTLALGVNGVSNAGATGDATGDCTACACDHCHVWDFTIDDGSGDGWGAEGSGATWTAGLGWAGVFANSENYNDLTIGLTKDIDHMVFWSITYAKTFGSGASNVNHMQLWNPFPVTLLTSNNDNSLGTDLVKSIDGDWNPSYSRVDINSGTSTNTVYVTRAEIHWRGQDDLFTENC